MGYTNIIQPYLDSFSGYASLAYYDFRTNQTFLHHATTTMRSASLIKLPILSYALTQVAKGQLDLSQRITLKQTMQVAGAGILHALQEGVTLSLQDLLTLMIIVSDNSATNILIELLGQANINQFIQDLGLQQTELIAKLQLAKEKQNERQLAGESNTTCAADILGFLIRLEQRALLPDDLTDLMISILKKQQFTEALARYLPTDEELTKDVVQVAGKSGCLRGLWHDAALIYDALGRPLYALVVLTDGSKDLSYSWEQEGMLFIANVSKAMFEVFKAES